MPLPQHSSTVRTVTPETTLIEAARIMVRDQVGALLIRKDADSLVEGIFTDRDLVKEVAEGTDLETATAARFTGRPIQRLPVDSSRREITEKMRRHGVRRIPLHDEDDEIVGIVALDDLVFELGQELFDLGHAIKTEITREEPWPDPDL